MKKPSAETTNVIKDGLEFPLPPPTEAPRSLPSALWLGEPTVQTLSLRTLMYKNPSLMCQEGGGAGTLKNLRVNCSWLPVHYQGWEMPDLLPGRELE